MQSINPFTGERIATYEQDAYEIIDQKLAQAESSFSEWKSTPLSDKCGLVSNLGKSLIANKEDLAQLAVSEMGKPISQAVAEVEKCAWLCEHYSKKAPIYLGRDEIETEAAKSWVDYEPLGVILGIMPWNFPYWQVIRFAVPTVLASNTTLLKHASNVTGCAEAIEGIFRKAGFPTGVFSHLKLSGNKTSEIIKDHRIRAVSLTGSENAGKSVASAAGSVLKKCVLELGGSNAFVILNDAKLDFIMDAAVNGRIQNNGQSCIAAKRFIVQEEIYNDFKNRLIRRFEELNVGDPSNPLTDIGPLARVDLAIELENQLNSSLKKGAKLLVGGSREGALFQPTIIENSLPGMPCFDQETFGPLAALTRVNSAEEAINLANRSNFGLGATICSGSIQNSIELGKEIEDGAVFVNEMVKSDPRLPFGGTKISGYGRELGAWGIREFTNVKTYFVK